MTLSEKALWAEIRNRQLGVKFRRQVPIGRWIADFASLDPRVVVEVDDRSHELRDERVRTGYLESRGFTVLRYDNEDIAFRLDGVLAHLEEVLADLRR